MIVFNRKTVKYIINFYQINPNLWWLSGTFAEQLIKSYSLKKSVTEFLPSSSAAHLEGVPMLHQQILGKVYSGKLLRHRLRHQLFHRLRPTCPRLTHHQSKVATYSSPHHVENPAKERRELPRQVLSSMFT